MSRGRALIIDDEPDIRELLEITLARMDIETRPAGDLGAARDALRRERFDLCLTDMRLPDGDGIDLVREIAERHPALPVAVITAHGNMESAITALKSGAFDFVTKPVDLKDLRNLVQQALRLRGAPDPTSRTLIGAAPSITLSSPSPSPACACATARTAGSTSPWPSSSKPGRARCASRSLPRKAEGRAIPR